MRRWLRSAAILCVRLYQRSLSRVLPPTCRFRPSCSEYTIQAIERHGLAWGLLLGLWRVLRCNPFCAGGDDPVPVDRTLPGLRRKPSASSSRTDELKAP